MIEEKIRDLIDRDIEGETTSPERAELTAVLHGRPEVKAYYERMVAVARALEHPRLSEAPADLRRNVLQEIAAERREGGGGESWLARIAALFAVPRVRYAMVGAAGIAVGLLGGGLALDGRVASTSFRDQSSGTLMAGRPGAGPVLEARTFAVPDASGSVRLVRGPDGVFVEIAVETAAEARVELTHDPAASAVRGILYDAEAGVTTRSEPGRLELVHSGNVTYRIAYGRVASSPARLAWRIRTGGGTTEGVLDVPVFEP